jgi:hypothetical protein
MTINSTPSYGAIISVIAPKGYALFTIPFIYGKIHDIDDFELLGQGRTNDEKRKRFTDISAEQ